MHVISFCAAVAAAALFTPPPPAVADAAMRLAPTGTGQGAAMAAATALPPWPLHGACPGLGAPEAARRAHVLSWARVVLNDSFAAGTSYSSQVFVRDTATFLPVALDTTPKGVVRAVLLKMLLFQLPNGDMACEGIGVNVTSNVTVPMLKSDASADQESSLVLAFARYINHTGDTAVLHELVASHNDTVGRTVATRLEMLLEFLGNTSTRTSPRHGLVWAGTRVDWGDVQNCQPAGDGLRLGGGLCHQQLDFVATPSVGVYESALYVEAIRAFAALVGASSPATAARWLQRAEAVTSNAIRWLWDEPRQKFVPHIYDLGAVCGPCNGSHEYACFESKSSPFLNLTGFDEADVYYHGGTAVAIAAGFLTRAQIVRALADMRANAAKVNPGTTVGLTCYPPYPPQAFPYEPPYTYQNAGDWTWFGARMVQNLIREGMLDDAEREIKPMIDRVCKHRDFREWYGRMNDPQGSYRFHGGAGELGTAIKMLQAAGR